MAGKWPPPKRDPRVSDGKRAARPFARIDDLDRVQGISAERLEQIRAQVTVSTPEVTAAKTENRATKKEDRPLKPTRRPGTTERKR